MCWFQKENRKWKMPVSEKGKFEISQKSSMDASLENIYTINMKQSTYEEQSSKYAASQRI